MVDFMRSFDYNKKAIKNIGGEFKMDKTEIAEMLQAQREFFLAGYSTHYLKGKMFRTNMLADLHDALVEYERPLLEALRQDLGKSEYEAYTTEFIPVMQELDYAFKKGGNLLKEKRLLPNKLTAHGAAQLTYAPKGCVLIIAPWNYPLQLTIMPLISAILAGNCCVVKPSELAPATAQVIETMLNKTFQPEYIRVVNGGAETAQALVAAPFDHIFFTGSQQVGRQVMAAAAENLTPVTLELGGKSPCIVTPTANIYKSAQSIIWAKLLNCGQTCVAPDYVLVCEEQKEAFVSSLMFAMREMYGQEPLKSPDYGRIVNKRHFDRLLGYIEPYRNSGSLACGGQSDADQLKIAPTILTNVNLDSPVMQEEIFGPILPVLTYDTITNVIRFINSKPAPLACYIFDNTDEITTRLCNRIRCGGVCVNDAMTQMLHPGMSFGGVGASGFGRYHGEAGFLEFSVAKPIFKARVTANALRRAPYTESKLQKLKQTFKLGVFAKKL